MQSPIYKKKYLLATSLRAVIKVISHLVLVIIYMMFNFMFDSLCSPVESVFDIKIKMCIKDKHYVQSCIITYNMIPVRSVAT